jgi:phytoene synthase
MLLAVMEPPEADAARPHARALAEAFQLTNFLRDVREDVTDYGRVYLPRSTLADHGVSVEQIAAHDPSDGFRDAMREEVRYTESRYREGVAGIRYLPDDCQFPVLLAAVLYAEHHRLLRALDYDVLSSRPSLGRLDYARVVARTWWHWRRSGDPETTFYRASAVSERPADEPADASRRGVARLTDRLSPRGSRGEVE